MEHILYIQSKKWTWHHVNRVSLEGLKLLYFPRKTEDNIKLSVNMTCGHDRETRVYTMLVNSVLYNKKNGLRGSSDNHCVFATVISSKLSILDADLPIWNLVELNTGGGCVGNWCCCFYLSVESFWNVILDSFSLFLCSFCLSLFPPETGNKGQETCTCLKPDSDQCDTRTLAL